MLYWAVCVCVGLWVQYMSVHVLWPSSQLRLGYSKVCQVFHDVNEFRQMKLREQCSVLFPIGGCFIEDYLFKTPFKVTPLILKVCVMIPVALSSPHIRDFSDSDLSES